MRIIGIGLVGIGIAVGVFVAWQYAGVMTQDVAPEQTGSERRVYVNDRYGYSFEYAPEYNVEEYHDGAFAFRDASARGEILFEGQVAQSAGEDGFEDLDEFLFERSRLLCAADGPGISIECTELIDREPLTTNAGVTGSHYYLTMVETNLETSTTSERVYGPVIAFDISPHAPAAYAALLMYPPLALSLDAVDAALLRSVAETLQMNEDDARTEEVLVLISEVRTEDDRTVVVADPVEWLQDDAAIRAAAADTECTEATAEECVPSLANNFYVRNSADEAVTYTLAADPSITLQVAAKPVAKSVGDLGARLADGVAPVLAELHISDAEVVEIIEVYTP